MTLNQKFGDTALYGDTHYDPTDDPKPDGMETAYHYVKHSAIDLPTEYLRKLYLDIAVELNHRGGITFESVEEEMPGPMSRHSCEREAAE